MRDQDHRHAQLGLQAADFLQYLGQRDCPESDRAEFAQRLVDSVETSLKSGNGVLIVQTNTSQGEQEYFLGEQNTCSHCDVSLPRLSPTLFSFNAPTGMCSDCNGLGTKLEVDLGLIVEHPELSLLDGASRWYGNIRKKGGWHFHHINTLAEYYGVDLELPWKDLPQNFRDVLLFGSGDEKIHFKFENEEGTFKGEST